MIARPRYSESSKSPMAFTVRSYAMADMNAIVLPTSNVHHAQRSPRRKAVTVMAIAISPKTTLKTPYSRKSTNDVLGGHRRRAHELRPRALGKALVTGSQDRRATWSRQEIRQCSRHRAPGGKSPIGDEDENPGDAAPLLRCHIIGHDFPPAVLPRESPGSPAKCGIRPLYRLASNHGFLVSSSTMGGGGRSLEALRACAGDSGHANGNST